MEVMQLQTKKHPGLLATTKKLGDQHGTNSPPVPQEGTDPADTFILDLSTKNVSESLSVILSPPVYSTSVQQPSYRSDTIRCDYLILWREMHQHLKDVHNSGSQYFQKPNV